MAEEDSKVEVPELAAAIKVVTRLYREEKISPPMKRTLKDLLLVQKEPAVLAAIAAFLDDADEEELVESLQSIFARRKQLPSRKLDLSEGVTYLFAYSACQRLAEEVAATSGGRVKLAEAVWDRFEDTWPNIFIKNLKLLRGQKCAVLLSLHSPGVLFEQLSMVYALARYGVQSLKVIIPYFPTGTMERVDTEGQVATAHSLARLLSIIPHACSGPTQVSCFDIHALQERFYFSDDVHVRLKSAVSLLLQRMERMPDRENVVIAFPDEGAWKRFKRRFPGFDLVICHKVRDGDRRIVTIKEGNPEGKHVVIVDDLVKTGGTLVKCGEALRAAGAAAVSCYCTHGVFPGETWRRFTNGDFKHFWITNSMPLIADAVCDVEPFEILSLAPLLHYLLTERTAS